eukprot:272182_1
MNLNYSCAHNKSLQKYSPKRRTRKKTMMHPLIPTPMEALDIESQQKHQPAAGTVEWSSFDVKDAYMNGESACREQEMREPITFTLLARLLAVWFIANIVFPYVVLDYILLASHFSPTKVQAGIILYSACAIGLNIYIIISVLRRTAAVRDYTISQQLFYLAFVL